MGQFAAIASLASAAGGASLSEAQAGIEEDQAQIAADQQELQVLQREADRKDRLASAMASQNAMAGARGVAAFEGSPLTILEDSMRREQVATSRDKFSTELSTLAMRSSAKIRKRFQKQSARLSLFQQGASMAGGIGG